MKKENMTNWHEKETKSCTQLKAGSLMSLNPRNLNCTLNSRFLESGFPKFCSCLITWYTQIYALRLRKINIVYCMFMLNTGTKDMSQPHNVDIFCVDLEDYFEWPSQLLNWCFLCDVEAIQHHLETVPIYIIVFYEMCSTCYFCWQMADVPASYNYNFVL